MQADAAGTSQSQDSAEVEACRQWYCVVVWGPGVLLQGTFNPRFPRRSQSQRAKVSLGQQVVERSVDLETWKGPLGTWMIREIERSQLPVSPET